MDQKIGRQKDWGPVGRWMEGRLSGMDGRSRRRKNFENGQMEGENWWREYMEEVRMSGCSEERKQKG